MEKLNDDLNLDEFLTSITLELYDSVDFKSNMNIYQIVKLWIHYQIFLIILKYANNFKI